VNHNGGALEVTTDNHEGEATDFCLQHEAPKRLLGEDPTLAEEVNDDAIYKLMSLFGFSPSIYSNETD